MDLDYLDEVYEATVYRGRLTSRCKLCDEKWLNRDVDCHEPDCFWTTSKYRPTNFPQRG